MDKTKKVLVTISKEQEQKILDKYGVHEEPKKIQTFWLRVFIGNAIIDRLAALNRYEGELYQKEIKKIMKVKQVSPKLHTLVRNRGKS